MRVKGPIIKPARITPQDVTSRLYEVRRPVALGVLALALLGSGWWGYRAWQGRREDAAQAVLTQALQTLGRLPEPKEGEKAPSEPSGQVERGLELLIRLRQEYPSSDAAEQALLQIGTLSYQGGEHQKALKAYQDYLEQYPTGPWMILAGLGKGYALEALERYEGAAATFRTLTEAYKGHTLTVEALMGLARSLMRLDRQPEALAAYRRVIEEYPATRWADQAEEAAAFLER
ncbi:MAG: tetratricopeptide repeat protein [candidate division NC10 bacterium]|nr:tetratricopeptide repeat protein [candidate division NC10 bacterium]